MSLFTINIYNDDSKLHKIEELLLELTNKTNKIMANIDDLIAQVDDLQVALDAEQAQIAAAIAGLESSIADLTAQLADGGTPEQRQALADKLTAIKEDLAGTIADAPTEG